MGGIGIFPGKIYCHHIIEVLVRLTYL